MLKHGDCANFVSQCLYAGKLAKMSGVLKYGWHHYKINIPIYTYTGATIKPPSVSYIPVYQISHAWGKVPNLKDWLKSKSHIDEEIIIKNTDDVKTKIADMSTDHCVAVLFFKKKSKSDYTHAAISGIVDKKSGNVYYYAHSNPRNGNDSTSSEKFGLAEWQKDKTSDKVSIIIIK